MADILDALPPGNQEAFADWKADALGEQDEEPAPASGLKRKRGRRSGKAVKKRMAATERAMDAKQISGQEVFAHPKFGMLGIHNQSTAESSASRPRSESGEVEQEPAEHEEEDISIEVDGHDKHGMSMNETLEEVDTASHHHDHTGHDTCCSSPSKDFPPAGYEADPSKWSIEEIEALRDDQRDEWQRLYEHLKTTKPSMAIKICHLLDPVSNSGMQLAAMRNRLFYSATTELNSPMELCWPLSMRTALIRAANRKGAPHVSKIDDPKMPANSSRTQVFFYPSAGSSRSLVPPKTPDGKGSVAQSDSGGVTWPGGFAVWQEAFFERWTIGKMVGFMMRGAGLEWSHLCGRSDCTRFSHGRWETGEQNKHRRDCHAVAKGKIKPKNKRTTCVHGDLLGDELMRAERCLMDAAAFDWMDLWRHFKRNIDATVSRICLWRP